MDKETVIHIHNGILFSYKEQNDVACRKTDRTRDHQTEKQPSSRQQMFSLDMRNLGLK
jgi:hypothetical protein